MNDFLQTAAAQFLAGTMVVASAAFYGFGHLGREINTVRSFWKTLPVILLAGVSIYFGGPPILTVALLLCALGDYFLSRGEKHFVPGLLAFLAGHIVYIVLFFTLSTGISLHWSMLVIVLYSSVFAAFMWTAARKHRWPVLAYIVVITAMAGISLTLPSAYFLTVVGAFVFVFSDSVLAVRMFVVSDQRIKLMLSWAVWVSYIAGQSLILTGVLKVTQPSIL